MIDHSTSLEQVRDYPRPPRLEFCNDSILVKALGQILAETNHSQRVLETFHPPTYYLPAEAINDKLLQPASGRSFCEWKGFANYFDVIFADQIIPRAIWAYPHPTEAFSSLAGWFALYPRLMDGCWVNDELVIPQPGGFYGGWITSQVCGPFKGDPAHPELI